MVVDDTRRSDSILPPLICINEEDNENDNDDFSLPIAIGAVIKYEAERPPKMGH